MSQERVIGGANEEVLEERGQTAYSKLKTIEILSHQMRFAYERFDFDRGRSRAKLIDQLVTSLCEQFKGSRVGGDLK